MGQEHAKTYNFGTFTPGPTYQSMSGVGTQQDSGKVSPPQWCFGTAERFGSRSPRGAMSPGPGAYDNASSIGKQDLSNRSTFPLYGFGTVDRDMAAKVFISSAHANASYGNASPGPAATYQKRGGLAGSKYSFGTNERFQREMRHLGDAAELPGPGSYSADSTLGSQRSSRLTTQVRPPLRSPASPSLDPPPPPRHPRRPHPWRAHR